MCRHPPSVQMPSNQEDVGVRLFYQQGPLLWLHQALGASTVVLPVGGELAISSVSWRFPEHQGSDTHAALWPLLTVAEGL